MREKIKNNKVLQVINKILKIISWVVLILLLILAGFLIYYVIMAKEAEKKGADYKPPMALYTIISPSMVPNINVYDVVFNVKVDDPNELEVGDIITFVSSDSYMKGMIITHRIVDKYVTNEGVQFKTKGDANVEADSSLVLEENVIGKVLFKIPQLGRVQFFLSSKSGWFIAILIPALAVIAYDIFKLFRLLVLKKQLKNKDDNSGNSSGIIEDEDGEKVLNLNANKNNENMEQNIANESKEENTEQNIMNDNLENKQEEFNDTKEETPNMVIQPNIDFEKDNNNNFINNVEPSITPKEEPKIEPGIDSSIFNNIPNLDTIKNDDIQTSTEGTDIYKENTTNNIDNNIKSDEEIKEEEIKKDAIIDALLRGNQDNNK